MLRVTTHTHIIINHISVVTPGNHRDTHTHIQHLILIRIIVTAKLRIEVMNSGVMLQAYTGKTTCILFALNGSLQTSF